jgi:hypothetical protein
VAAPGASSRDERGAVAPARPGGARHRSTWGVAAGLAAAVLLLAVSSPFALLAMPLGVLLVGLPSRRRVWWAGLLVLAWALALVPVASPGTMIGKGWALVLAAGFLLVTVLRPRWGAFSRALAALAGAVTVGSAALALTGGWTAVDAMVSAQFRDLASLLTGEMRAQYPDAFWVSSAVEFYERMAEGAGRVFPALLGLQSVAALALVWWAFSRTRGGAGSRLQLRPLREFRFNDSLVWVAIAGLGLLALPGGEGVARAGYNLLVFMGALYALRGIAVFVFLARGARSATSLVIGTLAALFFYQLVLTAALLVGLGDTWLDVRGRAVAAARG